MNFNIFSPLRSFYRLLVANPAPEQSESGPAAAPAARRGIVMASRAGAAPPRNNGLHHNGRGIELPLQSILAGLPLELQPRVIQAEVPAT